MKKKEDEAASIEADDFEVTELDDGDLDDVAGGFARLDDDNGNCGCNNDNCGCGDQ